MPLSAPAVSTSKRTLTAAMEAGDLQAAKAAIEPGNGMLLRNQRGESQRLIGQARRLYINEDFGFDS